MRGHNSDHVPALAIAALTGDGLNFPFGMNHDIAAGPAFYELSGHCD